MVNMHHKKFGNLLIVLCVISFLFGCSEGGASGETAKSQIDQSLISSDPALAMAERFNMGKNIEKKAFDVARNTVSYGVVIELHGSANASSIVEKEIKNLLPNYQPQWNKNLANAYSAHLSQDELRSLALDGNQSPYINNFKAAQAPAGEDMKSSSMSILTELAADALFNVIR